ncbi:helix-turn-helix domain-containing protein, partial [Neglectibacter sp. X4]|uniref:helix-turn-helix domain-containing protein n=1 Tax=Neglectibacter sp. X4 TaxID=2305472 RepID=UPI00352DDD44
MLYIITKPNGRYENMDIGKRIKARRKELGLSAEEVAERMGVSAATVYRYESNYISNMGVDKLTPIATAL